jgi:hypothetical protein
MSRHRHIPTPPLIWIAAVEFFISTYGSLVLAMINGFLPPVIREGTLVLAPHRGSTYTEASSSESRPW